MNVIRKGYPIFYALTRLRMNHQPLPTALPIKLVVIANGVRHPSSLLP